MHVSDTIQKEFIDTVTAILSKMKASNPKAIEQFTTKTGRISGCRVLKLLPLHLKSVYPISVLQTIIKCLRL